MKYRIVLILSFFTFIGGHKNLIAQSDFYDVNAIQEIKLYFSESNWDELLDSLYVQGLNNRLTGNVMINGTIFYEVGVRYKGFSSFSTARVKNPFNISLDYIYENQDYEGYNKIKLSNVIQDPSFVRAVLSYEVARKYMPSSEANYANVYVNDTLIGLYSNVEAVNKEFLDNHFDSRGNTFIKCNPESLDLNGENSNLSDTPGTDVTNYYSFYDLKSDDLNDWYDLVEFIDTLNQSPSNIESLLNVDRALWMHAFNYSVINFDSYVGYAQNYYLYQDDNGRFNPILWDLNMSFASYRLTDASDQWDGFTIAEAMVIDPLQHINSVSIQPRPLIRNLLSNDTFKRMYLAHIRTIIEENFTNQDYAVRAQAMQTLISTSVIADTNKFYSDADFTNNLTATVSDLVDYPGITELMDARTTYLTNYTGFLGAPVISTIENYPINTTAGDDVWITAKVVDASLSVMLAYRFSERDVFTVVSMLDDGTQNDGISGDSIYGAMIPNISNVVQYYLYAENDSTGIFSPERAAYEYYTLESNIAFQDLAINEVMASNSFTQTDESGDYDDWIELYNNTEYKISTSGMYLSDDQNVLNKWELPDVVIYPGNYFIVWADEDTTQSSVHANFKMDKDGDSLWLSYENGTVIDSLIFNEQYDVSTIGRYPNGYGSFIEMIPTFDTKNDESDVALLNDDAYIYPNPASDVFYLKMNQDSDVQINIYSMDGRMIVPEQLTNGEGLITLNTSQLSNGIYLIHLVYDDKELTKKVIITK